MLGPLKESWDRRCSVRAEIFEIMDQFPHFILPLHVGGCSQHWDDGVGTEIRNRSGAVRPRRIVVPSARGLANDTSQRRNGGFALTPQCPPGDLNAVRGRGLLLLLLC